MMGMLFVVGAARSSSLNASIFSGQQHMLLQGQPPPPSPSPS